MAKKAISGAPRGESITKPFPPSTFRLWIHGPGGATEEKKSLPHGAQRKVRRVFRSWANRCFFFQILLPQRPSIQLSTLGRPPETATWGDIHIPVSFVWEKWDIAQVFAPEMNPASPVDVFLTTKNYDWCSSFLLGFLLIAGSSQHPVLDNIVLCRRFFEMVMWKFTRVAALNSHVWCKRKVKGTFGNPSAPLQRMSSISCLLKVPRRKKAINSTKHNGFDTNQK